MSGGALLLLLLVPAGALEPEDRRLAGLRSVAGSRCCGLATAKSCLRPDGSAPAVRLTDFGIFDAASL